VFVGVAGSLVICFVYFVVQQLALALGTGGYLAPWLAGWLPNLLFGLMGLGLTARIR
jgi:lipopolysaccharide export system permease protein